MLAFLIAFVVVDAVITVMVVLYVMRRRNARAATAGRAGAFGSPALPPKDNPFATAVPAPVAETTAPAFADTPSGSFTRLFGGGNLRGLANFAKEQHPRIGDYVRSNWSGIPDQLPAVLGALVTDLEREAQARGLSYDRETLKSMLAVSLRSHHIGGGHDVLEALEKVA